MSPLVSILIPAYNAEPFVAAAVESALAQTYPHVEVVVVDDGSTDGTREALRPFEARGVRVVEQANRGAAAARNRAFAESRGERVTFLDGDDLLSPGHTAALAARLGARRDAAAVSAWARFHADPSEALFPPLAEQDVDPVTWTAADWAAARPMTQSGMFLLPRALVAARGGWDERLSLIDDFEFFARVLLGARAVLVTPEARLLYRSGLDGSLSGQRSRRAAESAFLSLSLGTGHLLAAEDSPRTRRAAAAMLQDFVFSTYPAHPDLTARAAARVADLGGSGLAPDGPPGFQRLRRLAGWRLARRVQHLADAVRHRP